MHDRHRKSRTALALAVLALLLSAGARAQDEDGDEAVPSLVSPGGLNLYYDSQGPLSFVTPTARETPRKRVEAGEVSGKSCQHGLSIPLSLSLRPTSISAAGGEGGYLKALADIRRKNPSVAGIYDVRVDVQTVSVLGIYRRTCTEVVARAFL